MYFLTTVVVLTLSYAIIPSAHASAGDRSMYFVQCHTHCQDDCDNAAAVSMSEPPQLTWRQNLYKVWHQSLLGWSCKEECKQSCMWRTVDYFHQHDKPTPQFFGKWPFMRIFGVQEPASAIASVLNLASYVHVIRKFQAQVPPSAPTYGVWFTYGWIAIFTWIFSTIFHCRDLPVTEVMDYMSAFAIVVFTNYIFMIRCVLGWSDPFRTWSMFAFLVCFYLHHAYSMVFVHFNYGYNMKVNLSLGIATSIGLLFWCARSWRRLPHVRNCAIFVVLVDALVLLEVFDFPPALWTFDAHALWHFATIPLPFFWYRFATDDCLYLLRLSEKRAPSAAEHKKLDKLV